MLDADGINAFAGRPEELRRPPAPTVLTPHPGELGRLLGTTAARSRRTASPRPAGRPEETGAIVVLKGHLTPGRGSRTAVCVNPTGNAGMATGGSGDVLTGLVAGLLAQGLDALDAAVLGVYVHGLAGDLLSAERGPEAIAAGDLAASLPDAMAALRRAAGGR